MIDGRPRTANGMGWLFWIVEALLLLAALAFALIAAFLAPSHRETFATLPAARLTDFAVAAALAVAALALAFAAEMLRRKRQQA